jgi:hypothetical protein
MYNTTPVQSFIATTLESPSNPYHSPGNDNSDPLVAHGWQNGVYVGALVSVICLIIIVRVFSTQLDNAIIFALVLTAVAIAAVMLLVH